VKHDPSCYAKKALARALVELTALLNDPEAAAAHRSDAALDWLLALVAEARVPVAVEVIDALALYRHNAKLSQRLAAAVTERGETVLRERLAAFNR
jgi:hypothetical protein